MPLFSYTAKDAQGKTTRGTVDAVSMDAARIALEQLHFDIQELSQVFSTPVSPSDTVSDATEGVLKGAPALPPLFQKDATESRVMNQLYARLIETLRLYAGWLLAWYFLIFALGSYQYMRELPFHFTLIEELFAARIILLFAFGSFLFLLLTLLHRLQGRGFFNGLFLLIVGVVMFLLFRANI